ncbi:MAG: DUF4248 domain-containing protein [Bacteroidaceae bacterium]|nr:DUF4248 domain-containing protein [Bacteroidaceae bacterium]
MKTSSTKKKKNPLSTRAARRGMTLAEWRRQNQWPDLLDCQTSDGGQQVNESTGQPMEQRAENGVFSNYPESRQRSSVAQQEPKRDSYERIMGLHPEDAALIAQLWEASGHRGIHIRTLAAMYFPDAVNSHCAVAQLSYELRCCHGLTEALELLHHPKRSHRFTCAQVRQIFLLYGSPGA